MLKIQPPKNLEPRITGNIWFDPKLKLQYDRIATFPQVSNEVLSQKKILEERAGTIKIKYQKILDLRNENQAKIVQNTFKTPFAQKAEYSHLEPHSEILYSQRAMGDTAQHAHRRAVSDPSAIIDYQLANMTNSRTIASGK